jgi:hypothetical protein
VPSQAKPFGHVSVVTLVHAPMLSQVVASVSWSPEHDAGVQTVLLPGYAHVPVPALQPVAPHVPPVVQAVDDAQQTPFAPHWPLTH